MKRGSCYFILGLVGLLGGCASPQPVTYNPQDSKALNVARAAGIDAKLKDVEVPKDTISSLTDSSGYGFAMAASGYNAPIPGFSPGQMSALNFSAWLLAPKADSARNSLFAWVPIDLAKDQPIDYLADLILDAASKAVEEMGYTPRKMIAKGGTDKTGIGVEMMDGDGAVCETKDNVSSACWIVFGLRDPDKLSLAPSFVGASGENWFFDPSDAVYSHYAFPQENNGLNELELLVKTSQYLPEWVYFYVAPKKVRLNAEETVKIPLIINQGKILYFVFPKV